MKSNNWTREELLLAFNLYCKIPFGQFHRGNLQVIKLAEFIGRTPSAVAMKLTNFASLDPHHRERGVSGLGNSSKLDREVWDEATSDWSTFAEETEPIVAPLADVESVPLLAFEGPTEALRTTKVRIGQQFFRKMILASYGKCCICGNPLPDLLIASHIIPWRDREDLRVNPTNGLCLCSLHDRAFDKGILTILPSYQIAVSPIIEKYLPNTALMAGLLQFHDQVIMLPDKFVPDTAFLEVHNSMYFNQG